MAPEHTPAEQHAEKPKPADEPIPTGGSEPAEQFVPVIEPSVLRWQTPDRYFEAHITADMFDSLVLVCINGGRWTRRAQLRTVAVGEDQVRKAIDKIVKRRLAQKYRLVSNTKAG